jgi:trehalose 6-phosphate synthase
LRLVVISNRVPSPTARNGAGGLAVAVRDALSDSGGVWFGWSGTRSRERGDAASVTHEDGIAFTTLPLTHHDFEHYYGGYANSVLWPLFHEQLHAMEYRESFKTSYHDVNTYFAEHAAALIEPNDLTWVHDYHLIPLGAELRSRGVTSRIGFFLHIPFPPFDVFRALPEHRRLLRSFMAYDLVGFQTQSDARNFADALTRALGASIHRDEGSAELGDERVRFGAFPIGIDADATAHSALIHRASRSGQRLTRALRGRKLVIGADRLDYTKGLVERFHAFETFLQRHGKELNDEMIYVQITAPSRGEVREYQEMTRELEAETGRINGRLSSIYWTPLRLIEQQVPRDTLLGYFSLADVGLVTPLRDGMNLVAKEYLAAQTAEDPGVLVLSSLAGAVEELEEAALVVNPYDGNDVADGIYRALTMPQDERRQRWERGMERLRGNTACIWRERFLSALVRPGQPEAGSSKRNLRPVGG